MNSTVACSKYGTHLCDIANEDIVHVGEGLSPQTRSQLLSVRAGGAGKVKRSAEAGVSPG